MTTKPICFICGKHTNLVGLTLIATKQNDKAFKKEIYYQVCEADIPLLLDFLSDKGRLSGFGLWEEVD